jgi:hypothetical protein
MDRSSEYIVISIAWCECKAASSSSLSQLLWKSNRPKLPLAEQEYYELALEDGAESGEIACVARRAD